VEWASAPLGPWHRSWDSLTDIIVTNYVTERSVPMFYRVVYYPPTPFLENITAEQALAEIISHEQDPDFVILDVRTAGEFATRHIKAAMNLDYYSATFEEQLETLDKTKIYLVYCASGARSSQAVQIMQGLGFLRIYNMGGDSTHS
jgi:rhodanese-related sulfurtransferase